MQEDEQFIKKLMTMLGSGRQLKLKSPNGQVIRVALDGSSNNETEESIEKHIVQVQSPKEPKDKKQQNIIRDIFQEKEGEKDDFITESLDEISCDFNALSKIREKNTSADSIFNEQSLDHLLLLDLQKLNDKESGSTKNDDIVFKQIISEIEPKREDKPKKISLANKNKKVANQPVIDFFKEQHSKINSEKQTKEDPFASKIAASSPIISRVIEDCFQLSHAKSETIKQGINQLRERHPQQQKTIQMISERLQQLQQKSKIVDQSLSLINSSISLKMDSYSFSMLSFNQNSEDPLCYIMAQFLNRAKEEVNKNKSKVIPSSFLFMYSQPLIDNKGRQIQEQINYFEEEQIIQKTLKEGKCKVDYIYEPATVEKMHYWIKEGLQILHFCGHGVQSEENYLLFENEKAESVNITVTKLTNLLKEGAYAPKLVFVASCHSQSAGRVFSEAGASHVICVRDQYQILDEACHQFVKLFYLTCINSNTTICESFHFAKKQLQLKGKFTKHQCQKFIIIKTHQREECTDYFQHRNQIQNFNDLNSHPYYNKYLLSRVEHYIPRCRDMYEILQLIIKKRRYITMIGQSGIGKSTLVRELVRYIQFRKYFKDGVIYTDLSRCENMDKLYELLDLQLFETPQLRLNKSPSENAMRLVKQLNQKNLLFIFDNCQNIMASEDRQNYKKLTEILMKSCKDIVFIFTNRHSIGRQIDYCSEVLYQLGKLTFRQSKTLFFNKIPRNITKKQYLQFEESQSAFFNFLNGHPEAICLTASLLAYRSFTELYQMLMKPNISKEMNEDISQEYNPHEGINKVVSTAMRISLNVINHKYKDASEMVKILSLLPNGLDAEVMSKIFPQGGKWKETVKRLISHSLVQCIEKVGCKYYLLHPHIIIQVEKQMSQQEKIKYHERICEQLVKKMTKIYQHIGTISNYSQRAQQIFLTEQDNYKTVFLRELSFLGQKYPLRKFYENVFKVQFEGLDEDEKNQFGDIKLTNAQVLANYQKNKKIKTLQYEKNAQKKQAIDLLIVYYVTILFVVKKVKNSSVETYLNYGLIIAQKKNKYLVYANLLRIKACTLLVQNSDTQAKTFFTTARIQFAQLGCGLGSACCEAAIGYIKYCESEYASAKMNLQNALKYYDQIPHPFGKHYLNRWLCSLKSKMNREEKELINHKNEAQKLIKQAKSNLRANNFNNISIIKHKLGFFPFRFLFDNISLFLQATFQVDLRPKFINSQTQYSINNVFKENKKNNYILDQINEEVVNAPIAATSISNVLFASQKVTATETLKRKEIISKKAVKKIEKPTKQISKQTFERNQKPEPLT